MTIAAHNGYRISLRVFEQRLTARSPFQNQNRDLEEIKCTKAKPKLGLRYRVMCTADVAQTLGCLRGIRHLD